MSIQTELENLNRFLGLPKSIRKHFEVVREMFSKGDFGSIVLFPNEYHSLIPKVVKAIK
jgi:hypothetical protein